MSLKKATIAILALLGAAGGGVLLFCKAGSWLVVADPLPARVDVVYTFAGENVRITYSRELMQRFPGAHWVLSDYLHQYSRILQREGYDMSKVTLVDTCPYTLSEVKGLADWMRGPGAQAQTALARKARRIDIALVSNPYHMRRIKCMVKSVFHDDALRFHYLPVPPDRYRWASADRRCWWRSKPIRSWVESELGKLVLFWIFS